MVKCVCGVILVLFCVCCYGFFFRLREVCELIMSGDATL